ncbi:Inner membrane protein YqiK [Rosistilla oblonga]|uniref:Inner membrane protein YqiK n=2 Tax=Rosistilla TaxID=2795779 RepID=A0A518J0J4_9BACT|nr:flotillin family protein [Rosistilla oblonga]QDS88936.1 Inner membrane protein YqiK [Rosistilla ulvae]QDV12975.1 Inner membrane protein YqiK [Rosistilla oblonga]QDV58860.1 Inner membrane protein YqiK [Rosistilla oblonga]
MSSVLVLGQFSDHWFINGIAILAVAIIGLLFLLASFAAMANQFYRKVGPDEAIVRSGWGKIRVATGNGIFVVPVIHQYEKMDLTLKSFEIAREGSEGLICQDNIRADIKVAFFIRVDKSEEEIREVAQSIGAKRCSQIDTLRELFDAKFSEALKTVGKQFDFVDLYDKRDNFKDQILKVIGTDLNGYRLDDAAIDFLEQTPLELLNPNNILDAEGIKKITELTSKEKVKENAFTREKEKTLKQQDVEAEETILQLEKQRIEANEKQQREVTEISARERAAAKKVQEEQRLESERARITTEEELGVANENKERQVLVALRAKERTDGIEQERVLKDRELEATERERVVGIAQVEKEKAIEVEKRNIQEVIRERVAVERAVVEEQEKIKDTEEFAAADRLKKVQITAASMTAEESLIKETKAAEAAKMAAELLADKIRIEAEASRDRSEKEMQAAKMTAEADAAKAAASGLAEAKVQEARAASMEKEGTAEAVIIEKKAVAEAKGIEARATAIEKEGLAEANVMQQKYSSEATGITEKAEAMKLLDGVGKEHEEFKLKLDKDKQVEIAAIDAQRGIAESQAGVVGEALKAARIDIVGGDGEFFDQITSAVKGGKAIDRFVYNSRVATDVKQTFFNGDPDYFRDNLMDLVNKFNLSTDDIKDLSIAALIAKLMGLANTDETRNQLGSLLGMASTAGITERKVGKLEAKPLQNGAKS